MRALVLRNGQVSFEDDYPAPKPAADEALVRVKRAGICETDLQLVRGYMGFEGVLGHEFVGIAETGALAGRRVVGEINCSCQNCEMCQAGRGNHCPQRTVVGIAGRDGAFADYLTIPQRNLHPVPDAVPDELAVFVEPLAAAYRIVEQFQLSKNMRCVVLGDGRLGNLCAQVLAGQGVEVTIVGKHDEKLRLLADLGLSTIHVDEASSELDAGRFARVDLVVEATGSPTGLPLALRLVRPCGTVVLKTTVAGSQSLALAPVVIDEVAVVGSRCGPFGPALTALIEGRVDVRPLISAVRPFTNAVACLQEAATPGVLKIQLTM